jgi:hypothetical protein
MMNRREFLATAAAVQLFTVSRLKGEDTSTPSAFPQVQPFDPARLRLSDFADADLDMPYNLTWLPRIANSVETDGPNRGFINLAARRGAGEFQTYNARIMESILSLAWFYASPRKWNQFYANKALRARLELALEFWCNLQSPDGKFSLDSPERWNLAATSSALKFISETLRLLKSGPPITPALHARVIDCCRKALQASLFDADMMSQGKSFASQCTNIFAGGATFLAIYPDAALSAQLKEQVDFSPTNLQSLCGYMYEADGPDLGSALNVHHENLRMAYHYWRGTHFGDILIEEENLFGKWLAYNLLPEPSQPFWIANSGIDTRQQHAIFQAVDTPLADRSVIMRAFATVPDHRVEQVKDVRARMEEVWPRIEPPRAGESQWPSPSHFLAREYDDWRPTAEQITEAGKMLRPLNEDSFVEQMRDTREPIVFTYLRRPNYYAAFASAANLISKQQRLGLTLVWSPVNGVILQSQAGGTETAWGTSLGDALPFEASGIEAHLGDDNATITYPLPGTGSKTINFAADRIHVTVEASGEIVEHLPVFDPKMVFSPAEYSMRPAPVQISGPRPAACSDPDVPCAAVLGPVPNKTLYEVELRATGKLEYEIRPS